MTDEEQLRAMVVSQCKAVEHLCHTLACIYSDKATAFASGAWDLVLEMNGEETARMMELLGNVINNMDAVTEDDMRFAPVFEAAQERWPVPGCATCGATP